MDLQATLEVRSSEQLLLDSSSDAVFVVDLDADELSSANARLEELTGLPLGDLVGARPEVLSPPPDEVDRATPFGRPVYGHPGLYEEVCLGRADGFVASVTIRVAHVTREGRRLAICVVRDDTERRMLERELITKHLALRSAHQELEHRVDELRRMSAALEDRKREIGELSTRVATVSRRAMLAEVVAEVAHCMNNPLAAVSSSIRMLGRTTEAIGDPEVRDRARTLVARSSDACARMARVVEDLRVACRAGSVGASVGAVRPTEQIEAALALLSHRVPPDVRLELDLDRELVARGAPDEIHHAVLNVVDNALQAVGRSGVVRVECRAAGEMAEVVVSDDGPGIDPAIAEAIFEPFVTTKAKGQGTGLGLSMVRRIVNRFGGSVEVEPKGALGGATFRIRLRREVAHVGDESGRDAGR